MFSEKSKGRQMSYRNANPSHRARQDHIKGKGHLRAGEVEPCWLSIEVHIDEPGAK